MKPSLASTVVGLAGTVVAWSHSSGEQLRTSLKSGDTLVAFIHLLVKPSEQASQALEAVWTKLREEADTGSIAASSGTPAAAVRIASVDCAIDAQACDDLDVASYPAIRFFGHGSRRMTRYRGPRRTSDIASFLHRIRRPAVSQINAANHSAFAASDDVVLVLAVPDSRHYAASDVNVLTDRFSGLARRYHDRYSFAIETSTDDGGSPLVRCFHSAHSDGDDDSDAHMNHHPHLSATAAELLEHVGGLDDFVRRCAEPVVPELTRRSELGLLQSGKSVVYCFYHDERTRRGYIDAVQPLARRYRDYLVFATVDAREYADLLVGLGLGPSQRTDSSAALLAVQNPSTGNVYPFPTHGSQGGRGHHADGADIPPVSAGAVEQFLVSIAQGQVPPWTGETEVHEAGRHDEL